MTDTPKGDYKREVGHLSEVWEPEYTEQYTHSYAAYRDDAEGGGVTKRKLDPVDALFETARLLCTDPERALQKMSSVTSQPDLPREWTGGLRRLTKQVRRALAREEKAREAFRAGRGAAAVGHLRKAKDINRKSVV